MDIGINMEGIEYQLTDMGHIVFMYGHDMEVGFLKINEPIIDEETWKLANKIKARKKKTPYAEDLFNLTGLLYCADCGSKLIRHEQETIINFNAEEQMATLYTRDPSVMRKVDALVTVSLEKYLKLRESRQGLI